MRGNHTIALIDLLNLLHRDTATNPRMCTSNCTLFPLYNHTTTTSTSACTTTTSSSSPLQQPSQSQSPTACSTQGGDTGEGSRKRAVHLVSGSHKNELSPKRPCTSHHGASHPSPPPTACRTQGGDTGEGKTQPPTGRSLLSFFGKPVRRSNFVEPGSPQVVSALYDKLGQPLEYQVRDASDLFEQLHRMDAEADELMQKGDTAALQELGAEYNRIQELANVQRVEFKLVESALAHAVVGLQRAKTGKDWALVGKWMDVKNKLENRMVDHRAALAKRAEVITIHEDSDDGSSGGSAGKAGGASTPAAASNCGPTANTHDAERDRAPPPPSKRAANSKRSAKQAAWMNQKTVTEQHFQQRLSAKWACTYESKKYSGPNLHGQCLVLESDEHDGNGLKPFCEACKKQLAMDKLAQHCVTKMHKRNIAQTRVASVQQQRLTKAVEEWQTTNGGFSGSTPMSDVEFRCDLIMLMCGSNLSASALEKDFDSFCKKHTKHTTISRTHICDYLEPVVKFVLAEHDKLKSHCYKQYSMISDGTPSFWEAEAIATMLVTQDFRIVTLLEYIGLLERSPTAERYAEEIKKCLDRRKYDIDGWRAVAQDRAAVNGKSTTLLEEEHGIKVFRAKCNPHSLSVSCQKASTPNLDRFLGLWSAIHVHSGSHSRLGFKEKFGVAVHSETGVRWCLEYEKTVQLVAVGFQNAVDHVQNCLDNGWSEASSKKLLDTVSENPLFLGAVMVEAAAVVNHLLPFVKLIYDAEGNNPLQFILEPRFKELDDMYTDASNRPEPTLEAELKRAREHMLEAHTRAATALESIDDGFWGKRGKNPILHPLEGQDGKVNWWVGEVSACVKASLDGWAVNLYTVKFSDGDKQDFYAESIETMVQNYITAKETLKQAMPKTKVKDPLPLALRDKLDRGEAAAKAGANRENKRRELGTVQSYADLLASARAATEPVFKYYGNQYLRHYGTENGKRVGDLRDVRLGIQAAALFDIDNNLRGATEGSVKAAIRRLDVFGFKELTPDLFSQMDGEVSALLQRVNAPFDWAKVSGAAEYDSSHTKGVDGWRDDTAEKARRNWERWRSMLHPANEFPSFSTALRLVALVQPSSAFVERCFSQLKLIVEATGSETLADLLLLRMLLRCNRAMYEEFDIVKT